MMISQAASMLPAQHWVARLEPRLWNERGARLSTKVAVYKAVVVATLLYGCESWNTSRRHVPTQSSSVPYALPAPQSKDHNKIPNTEVLSRCEISGIEAFIIKCHLRWASHVRRMPDSRIPKARFYAELQSGSMFRGRPLLRYKDNVKANMKSTGIDPKT